MRYRNIGINLKNVYYLFIVLYTICSFALDGQGITSLLMYASIGVGMLYMCVSIRRIKSREFFILCSVVLYCIFCVISTYSSSYSMSSITTKGRLISTMAISVHVFLMPIVLGKCDGKKMKKLFDILCVVSVLVTFATYGYQMLIYGFQGYIRLGAELGGINTFGMYLGILSVYAYSGIYDSQKYKSIYIILFILLAILSLTSGSRKAMLGIAMGCVGFSYFNAKNNKAIMVLRWGIIALVLLYLFSTLSITESVWQRFSTLWDSSNSAVASSDDSRSRMIEAAIQGWKESPIWGHGFNSFTAKNNFGTYSHCNYAELLFNTGILGLILFYIPRIYLIVCYWKFLKSNKDPFLCYLLITMLLLMAFDFACVSYYSFLLSFVWPIAGTLLTWKDYENSN